LLELGFLTSFFSIFLDLNSLIFNLYKNLLNIIETFFEDNLANIPKEWKIFKKIFDKKNIARKDCLLLPFKAVSKALKL